jgi:hypothetical protein
MPNGQNLNKQPPAYNPEWCRERHEEVKREHVRYERNFRDNEEAHREILRVVTCVDKKLARITVWAMIAPGMIGIGVGAILSAIAKGLF